jgi:hypothetical protein
LEDLSVFKVKKANKKGKEHEYWHAAWMAEGEEGGGAGDRKVIYDIT